jgi:hypothetical protein
MNKDLEQTVNEIYDGTNESLQTLLIELRKIGLTQMESLKLFMYKLNLSLREADDIILNSKAWEDRKADTLKLRDDFESSLYADDNK